jgi:hypothetical protein
VHPENTPVFSPLTCRRGDVARAAEGGVIREELSGLRPLHASQEQLTLQNIGTGALSRQATPLLGLGGGWAHFARCGCRQQRKNDVSTGKAAKTSRLGLGRPTAATRPARSVACNKRWSRCTSGDLKATNNAPSLQRSSHFRQERGKLRCFSAWSSLSTACRVSSVSWVIIDNVKLARVPSERSLLVMTGRDRLGRVSTAN